MNRLALPPHSTEFTSVAKRLLNYRPSNLLKRPTGADQRLSVFQRHSSPTFHTQTIRAYFPALFNSPGLRGGAMCENNSTGQIPIRSIPSGTWCLNCT